MNNCFNIVINNLGLNINRIHYNQRLAYEYYSLKQNGHIIGIQGYPFKGLKILNNNLFEWQFEIEGGEDSPYSGGLFYLKAKFPENFPNKRPEICFITPIYHLQVKPNGSHGERLGHICLMLLNWWKPSFTMKEVILNIILMLYLDQCPDSPYGMERADLYKHNKSLYIKRCQYFTKKYANPSLPCKDYGSKWDFSIPENLTI